jgi:hypothetical protein
MYDPTTSQDTHSAISSPESADGPTRCDSPDGPTTVPSGPEVVHVNLSARQALEAGLTTRDTFGLTGVGSLRSEALQLCLESRLRARMDVDGSPEYALTWKHWIMPSGAPICALRARARPISDSDYFGWPTPMAGSPGKPGPGGYNPAGNTDNGRKTVALVVGWPTPRTPTGGPESSDRKRELGRTSSGGSDLASVAQLTGWSTPTSRDHKDGHYQPNVPINALLGRQAWLSRAATDGPGALNPAHSRWLMGFPVAWDDCAAMVTRSSRKSRRSS